MLRKRSNDATPSGRQERGSLCWRQSHWQVFIAMQLSRTFRASWSIGLVATLLTAVPPGRIARAENISGGALAAGFARRGGKRGAFRHLRALQEIASASGGNRAAGTPGYDRSAEYVAERLKEAGYLVHFEEFEFPFFEERVPPALLVTLWTGAGASASRRFSYLDELGFERRDSAAALGEILGRGSRRCVDQRLRTVDFEDFERGSVALIRRGTCPFQTKVENAQAVGAVGVVIMNEGTAGRTDAFSGS